MSLSTPVEIYARPNSVTIGGGLLFADPSNRLLRDFLKRAFSLPETRTIVLKREQNVAEVRFGTSGDDGTALEKLARVLKIGSSSANPQSFLPSLLVNADILVLDGELSDGTLKITRTGQTLSSWRVRELSPERVRISHPKLGNRNVAFRLAEELSTIHGITRYRRTPSGFVVDLNPALLSAEQFIGAVERAWPRVLRGHDAPAFPTKLILSASLLTAAVAAHFFVPALTLFVLVAAVAYGFPNVLNAIRQLKHGEIGLPVLYATGLLGMVWSRSPLSSAIMAVLMQSWPRLTEIAGHALARELFLNQRRRAVWARKRVGETEQIVACENLVLGDVIVVRTGEYLAADGIVAEGIAAIDEDMLTGVTGAIDKSEGDAVYASTFVRTGEIEVRVTAVGDKTTSRTIANALPRGPVRNVPSSTQAEYVANRNAKPALAFAAASLLATRVLRSSQAMIRPDYATGPRLSAELSSLSAIATALRHGIFVRSHSAIDRLLGAHVYVIDETANFAHSDVVISRVDVVEGATELDVLKLAATAFATRTDDRAVALSKELSRRDISIETPHKRRRLPGSIRFTSDAGADIDVASSSYIVRAHMPLPAPVVAALAADLRPKTGLHPDPSLQSIWVLRDGTVLGVVRFERRVHSDQSIVSALRSRNSRAQFLYVSGRAQDEADAAAKPLGIDAVYGGLNSEDKAEKIRTISRRTVWIGDGSHPNALPASQASAVSVSTSGLKQLDADRSDIVLLQPTLTSIVNLRQIANAHLGRLRSDYQTVYLCNVAGAVGGVAAGFGSLQSGLLSNLGTAIVYALRCFELKSVARDIAARDSFRLSSLVEDLPALELRAGADSINEDVVFDLPVSGSALLPADGI